MSNIFSGIYRSNDALTAARYGLEVTGQNIANANTPGYTRQASGQVAVGTAVGVPTIHSGTLDNGGVRTTGAARLADNVLNSRMRDEHARSAQVDTTAARYADIENIFREPSNTGLAEQLHDFWNAWGDVANTPGGENGQVPREMLLSSADSTVTMLGSMNSALDDVATAAKSSLDATVESVNSAAKELTDLNTKLAIGSATNANVNALLDRRDVLLDQLSSAVGAKATLNANGTASVTLPGADGTSKPLVSTGGDGTPPFQYAVLGATYAKNAAGDPAGPGDTPLSVKLGISGLGDLTTAPDMSAGLVPVTPGGSTANAEMQTINETVKSYRDKLDGVAQALAKTVNDVQANGYTLDGTSGATKPMFTTASGDSTIANITAANITVALTGKDAWQQVAAADTQSTDSSGNPIGNVDGGNALAASLKGSDPAGPDTAYSSLVGDLGRASSSAQQQQATQSVITSSVNTLQTTASGVSFDEEVSNMLTYQMAFQASSRVLTTLDSMLDTLINRTGLVGR